MVFIVTVIILSLDQISKFLAARNLSLNQSVPVVRGVIHFTLIHNRGAAFGILRNQLPLFIFTTFVAIILICFNLKSLRVSGTGENKIYKILFRIQ